MAAARSLFATVPDRDSLGFWDGPKLKARAVVDFLGFDKREVAAIAGVAPASVRFDHKMPREVLDRLEEIACLCGLVAQFFDEDVARTTRWFKTCNPLLGDLAPRDMIRRGRVARLRQFVMRASSEATPATPTDVATAPAEPVPLQGAVHALVDARRQDIAALCRQHGVRRLAVFGSALRPDFDPARSDLDIVVEFGSPHGESAARQYFDFKAALERLFARPVDLVELSAVPESRLKRIIERTQVPLYAEAA